MKKITGFPDKLLLFAFVSIVILSVGGCSVWTNFTTYFNLYYNAEHKFQDAEKQITDQKKEVFTVEETKPSGQVNQNLTSVVEKLSRLLQFKSESGYVDDALLMIGKCFFYQQDYIKALRKFTELNSSFPKSDLTLESKLWIAKTQFRLKNFDEGNQLFEDVKTEAIDKKENDILTDAYIEQISYLISIQSYDEAINNIVKLIEVSGDDQKNALITYELGKLYLEINQPENAAKAFVKVLDYAPDYKTEFDARLAYGKVQRLLKQPDKALGIFKDLKSEANFNEFSDQTDLEIGLTYLTLDRTDDAFNQLVYVDTTYKQSPNSGIALYNLGKLMENKFSDFDSAFTYYRLASTSTAPVDTLEEAKKKVATFTKYKTFNQSITNYKTQLLYLIDSTKFIQDSLAYVAEQARLDSINQAKLQEKEDLAFNTSNSRRDDGNRYRQQTGNTGNPSLQQQSSAINKISVPTRPNISVDSIKAIIVKNEYELGGLFFTELNKPDSAYLYYNHILTNYPNSSYTARAIYALGSYYLTKDSTQKADSLFEVIYHNYKNESIVNAAADKLNKPLIKLNYDPAAQLYIAAEHTMMSDSNSAAVKKFLNIYNNYPNSSFASKALYTTGWILENKLELLDSAAVIYDSVLMKFPSSQYARAVQQKISVYNEEQKRLLDEKDSVKSKLDSTSNNNTRIDSLANLNQNIEQVKDSNQVVNPNKNDNLIEEPAPNIPPPVNPAQNDSLKPEIKNNLIDAKDSTGDKSKHEIK